MTKELPNEHNDDDWIVTENSVIHIKSWNAAIEAVVKVATGDYHVTADEIRKLKK